MGKKHKRRLSRIRTEALQIRQRATKERERAEWLSKVAVAEANRAAECWVEVRRLIGMRVDTIDQRDRGDFVEVRYAFTGFELSQMRREMLRDVVMSVTGKVARDLEKYIEKNGSRKQ